MTRTATSRAFCKTAQIRTIAGLAIGCVAIATASPLSAQTVETKDNPEAGDMVLLRDVPQRPGHAEGRGEALTANLAPNQAFADATALGISQLDDADAAEITSSAINELGLLSTLDGALANTEILIADAVRDSQSVPFGDSSTAGLTSFVNGAVGSAMASTDNATRSALGGINSALSGLNLGGNGQ